MGQLKAFLGYSAAWHEHGTRVSLLASVPLCPNPYIQINSAHVEKLQRTGGQQGTCRASMARDVRSLLVSLQKIDNLQHLTQFRVSKAQAAA